MSFILGTKLIPRKSFKCYFCPNFAWITMCYWHIRFYVVQLKIVQRILTKSYTQLPTKKLILFYAGELSTFQFLINEYETKEKNRTTTDFYSNWSREIAENMKLGWITG